MSGLPAPHHATRRTWTVFGAALLLSVLIGARGFWLYEVEHSGHGHFLNALYHSVQLLVLHTPLLEPPINMWLEVGRWFALVLFVWAAGAAAAHVLGGGLTRVRLWRVKDHVVIVGPAALALEMARCLRDDAGYVRCGIVVVTQGFDENLEPVRRSVRAIIVTGQPASQLERVHIERARRLIALSEADALNVEVILRAATLCGKGREAAEPLICEAQVADVDLREALRRHNLGGNAAQCQVRFFDFFDEAARHLLLQGLPLDHDGVSEHETRLVHLVIVGFGNMGRAVAVKAAQLGHFVNGGSVKISVIDEYAAKRENELLFRYPHFREVCDITFSDVSVRSPLAIQLLKSWCAATGTITSVVICLDNDALAIDLAMRMLTELGREGLRVAIRLSQPAGLATLLPGASASVRRGQLQAFGSFDSESCKRLVIDQGREEMARLVHKSFKELAAGQGRTADDPSVRDWNELKEEDFKESSRQQVDHIAIKLRGIGCEETRGSDPRDAADLTPHEVERLAELEHSRWMAERVLAGWSYAPPPRNAAQRTNPNMLTWAALAPDIKEYDFDAVRKICELLKVRHSKICRRAVRE